MKLKTLILACSLLPIGSFAQTAKYNPAEAFSNLFYTHPGNNNRTAEGRPGSGYWQNRADYQINATLDTLKQTLTASETISYTNNSPNQLNSLWLHLD